MIGRRLIIILVSDSPPISLIMIGFSIEEELYIVSKKLKYSNCYYLINFSKNIDNMIHLKSKFKEYMEDYNIDIVLVDVKEFYDRSISLLKNPKQNSLV